MVNYATKSCKNLPVASRTNSKFALSKNATALLIGVFIKIVLYYDNFTKKVTYKILLFLFKDF